MLYELVISFKIETKESFEVVNNGSHFIVFAIGYLAFSQKKRDCKNVKFAGIWSTLPQNALIIICSLETNTLLNATDILYFERAKWFLQNLLFFVLHAAEKRKLAAKKDSPHIALRSVLFVFYLYAPLPIAPAKQKKNASL